MEIRLVVVSLGQLLDLSFMNGFERLVSLPLCIQCVNQLCVLSHHLVSDTLLTRHFSNLLVPLGQQEALFLDFLVKLHPHHLYLINICIPSLLLYLIGEIIIYYRHFLNLFICLDRPLLQIDNFLLCLLTLLLKSLNPMDMLLTGVVLVHFTDSVRHVAPYGCYIFFYLRLVLSHLLLSFGY